MAPSGLVAEIIQLADAIFMLSAANHQNRQGTKSGEYEETDIPPAEQDRFERYRAELIEATRRGMEAGIAAAVALPPDTSMRGSATPWMTNDGTATSRSRAPRHPATRSSPSTRTVAHRT